MISVFAILTARKFVHIRSDTCDYLWWCSVSNNNSVLQYKKQFVHTITRMSDELTFSLRYYFIMYLLLIYGKNKTSILYKSLKSSYY